MKKEELAKMEIQKLKTELKVQKENDKDEKKTKEELTLSFNSQLSTNDDLTDQNSQSEKQGTKLDEDPSEKQETKKDEYPYSVVKQEELSYKYDYEQQMYYDSPFIKQANAVEDPDSLSQMSQEVLREIDKAYEEYIDGSLDQEYDEVTGEPKQDSNGTKWYCYMLQSISKENPFGTYIGMTNEIERRLRQHNKYIKGGAKYTSSKGPWQFVAHLSGFADQKAALQAEWKLKDAAKKNLKQFCGPVGKVKLLIHCLTQFDYWTNYYRKRIKDEKYTITIQSKYIGHLEELQNKQEFPNLTILEFGKDYNQIDELTNDIGTVEDKHELHKLRSRDLTIQNCVRQNESRTVKAVEID